MSLSYLVESLSASKHRREEFSCEEPELTEFLRQRALIEMQARASACFVLAPEEDTGRVAGFYTLSATTISLAKLPPELAAQLPKYPNLPATLLGRLARDQKFRGAGLGESERTMGKLHQDLARSRSVLGGGRLQSLYL